MLAYLLINYLIIIIIVVVVLLVIIVLVICIINEKLDLTYMIMLWDDVLIYRLPRSDHRHPLPAKSQQISINMKFA